MSALLPTLPVVSRIRLRSASTGLLRQPNEKVLHLLQLRAPHGAQAPHGAHSGKHKWHGVNVQVLADPVGRLVWASPALPGARHDMDAAREHGLIDALNVADVRVIADAAYQAVAPRSACRSVGAGLTPTPAATDGCRGHRRKSGTSRTSRPLECVYLRSWASIRPGRAGDGG